MSRVSEHDATVAVEAAARKVYEVGRERAGSVDPTWDELEPLQKRPFREGVLPFVWAALEALPDNRATIWLEGNLAPGDKKNPYLTS